MYYINWAKNTLLACGVLTNFMKVGRGAHTRKYRKPLAANVVHGCISARQIMCVLVLQYLSNILQVYKYLTFVHAEVQH